MNEKNKKPQIRFAGFTDDWEQRKLGEIADIRRGASPRPIQNPIWFDKDSDIGWLRIADVTEQNGKIYRLEQKLSEQGQKHTLVLTEPHLILSIAATVGKPVINYIPTGIHDGFIVFLNLDADMEFLYQWLGYFQENWKNLGQSGSQVNINSDLVRNLEISLPNKAEQTAIGNFFKQLDETIALHQRKYEKYKNLKISYLEKMFPKENEQFPELRFPEFTDAWEQRKLGEVVDFYSGLTYSPDNVVENGTLVLRSSNVHENQIVTDDNVFVSPNVVNSDNVQIGDIIVVVRNGSKNLIGKHARIQRVMPNTVIGAFMTGIRSSNPEFLSALLDTQKFNDEIDKNLGATINQITTGNFKQMEFYFPCEKEQTAIGHFFKQLDETITLHQRKAEKYKQIKQAYLEKMFV